VQVVVEGDRLRVSFEGSTPAAAGPINDPAARCDVRCALKGLLSPFDVGNEGHVMAVDFDVTPGLVVSPERPAPVDSYGYVGVALIELVIRALAGILPDRAPANGYQVFGVDLFRIHPRDGEPFVFTDVHDGGAGGRPAHDGPVLVFAGDGDTRNPPVEVIEHRYPLRVERHALLPELGGAGRHRGGPGVARDFRMLEPGISMQFTVENVGDTLARGLRGGGDGAPGYLVLAPDTLSEEILRERIAVYGPFAPGDVVSARSGGGGGWGDPLEREPERVVADVRGGYITPEAARDVHGVVLIGEGDGVRADLEATAELRAVRTSPALSRTEADRTGEGRTADPRP
jgi:N-methylhydantoinase B